MVPPQAGRLSVPLAMTGVYGKFAPGDGLAVLGGGAGLPAGLPQAAGEWLRVFLATRNRRIAAAQRLGTAWWVFRPDWDVLVDASGRDLGFVAFGALPGGVGTAEIPGLLLDLAGVEVAKPRPPEAIEVAPVEPDRSAPAAIALLALVLGEPATVPTFDEAAAILAAAAGSAVAPVWVAFLPDQRPVRLPDGLGLVISRDEAPADTGSAALVRDHGPGAILDLGLDGLPAAFPAPGDRLRAIGATLGQPDRPTRLTAEGAAWMARTPAGRAAALTGLPASEVAGWLRSASAHADDLPALADRLGPDHADAARRLLRGRPGAAAASLRLFPADPAGAVSLVGPEVGRLWDRLADEGADPPTQAEARWFLGEVTGLESVLTLVQVAHLAAADPGSAEGLLLAALERAGLHQDIAAGLIGPGLVRPTGPPPSLRPASGWLAPFPAERWLDAGTELAADPGWRVWWLEGVQALVGAGRLGTGDLLEAGVRHRDRDLMTLGGAPGSLIAWATTDRPVVLPPTDGAWPGLADDGIAASLDRGGFFARAAAPDLIRALEWVAGRNSGRAEFARAGRFATDLRNGRPAEPGWLAQVVGSLPRAILLRQVAAQGVRPPGPERAAALAALLAAPGLGGVPAAWLRALLLDGTPLGATPDWSAADLIELLPVLDPVRDVVRLVLGRAARGEGEAALLGSLMARLRAAPTPPIGGIPDRARAVRPDWVAALVGIPGWEGLDGPAEVANRVLLLARNLPRQARVDLAEQIRRDLP